MRQLKTSFGFWSAPPATATGNDGFTQGPGNPSPEEIEVRTLPTQENMFPHQTLPNTHDEAMDLTLGESARDSERGERGE